MLSHTQLELRDKNDRLHAKLEQLQDRYGSIAHVKTDLSSQLLSNEEEKLKVTTTRNLVAFWSFWSYSILTLASLAMFCA